MAVYPSDQVQETARKLSKLKSEYERGNKTHLVIIDSGAFKDQPAGVTYSPVNKNLSIGLSLEEFTNEYFSVYNSAFSLFKAFYIYEEAQKDPKRFITDFKDRISLEIEAWEATIKAFSSNNRINPSSAV